MADQSFKGRLLGPIDGVGLQIVKAVDQEAKYKEKGRGPDGQVRACIRKCTLPRVAGFKYEKRCEVLTNEEQYHVVPTDLAK